jgi:hypothetical protein
MDLAALRKLKNQSASIAAKLAQAAETQSSGGESQQDDRFWKLTMDKAGNGSATIRFLVNSDPDKLSWVKYWSHGFKGPTGKWYIENSLTTFGEADPVSEMNKELWETGIEANKKLASDRKRKLHYVSNVLVIRDPANPENEGKVFLFKYGKSIFDMIMEKIKPTIEDEEAVPVFDPWEGAELKIRIHKEAGYPKYTKSTWGNPKPLADDDDEILAILNKSHNLDDILDRKNFKSYEELKKRLDSVLNTKGASVGTAENDLGNSEEEEEEEAPKPRKEKKAEKPKAKVESGDDDDDDLSSYFKKLAEED